jgi:hypothetical protein
VSSAVLLSLTLEIDWDLNGINTALGKEYPMRFQPGQSGNPAGRPPGALNEKTLAARAVLEEHAEEILTNLMDRAKEGHGTAMRLCLDRLVPTGLDRPLAIELPMIKTPEDAELALTVVLGELAAGKLTIREVSALITVIDRMLRLAERMWKYQQARLEAAGDQDAPEADVQAPRAAQKPTPPLYSPVNSRAEPTAPVREGADAPAGATRESTAPPLARAA